MKVPILYNHPYTLFLCRNPFYNKQFPAGKFFYPDLPSDNAVVDAGAIVSHVPKILYHWRIHEGSTAGNSVDKAYAFDNGCRAIEEHLKRSTASVALPSARHN